MKNLLYILITASLLASCKKDDPMPISKTYTGKLVADCNMVPMTNSPIKVFIREPQSFGSNTIINDFTTDANGNFKFTVNLDDGKYVNEVRLGGTSITPDGPNENAMGTIIASPTANFVVKLKVNNPYGGDTLSLANYDNLFNSHKIAGPFKDSIFNPIYNYSSPLTNMTLSNKNSISVPNGHEVYSGTSGTSSFVSKSKNFDEVIIKGCSGTIDTIVKIIN